MARRRKVTHHGSFMMTRKRDGTHWGPCAGCGNIGPVEFVEGRNRWLCAKCRRMHSPRSPTPRSIAEGRVRD
jgi:hypothetical protein